MSPPVSPTLTSSGDALCCPHIPFLINLLGNGLYFFIFDAYKRCDCDAAALRFTRSFGLFFEDYVYELLSYGTRNLTRLVKSPEVTYRVRRQEMKSSDAILIYGDVAVFVEATKKRFNYLETLCGQDEQSP